MRLLDKNGAPVSDLIGGTLENEVGAFNGSKAARIWFFVLPIAPVLMT